MDSTPRLLLVSRQHPALLVGRRPSDTRQPYDQLRLAVGGGGGGCAAVVVPIRGEGLGQSQYFEILTEATSSGGGGGSVCIGVSLLADHPLDTAPGRRPGSVGLVRATMASRSHSPRSSHSCWSLMKC